MWRLESWDFGCAYLAPVVLIVSLLMSRVETFRWLSDTVKADKIPLVAVSNTRRGRNFMTESQKEDRVQKLQK